MFALGYLENLPNMELAKRSIILILLVLFLGFPYRQSLGNNFSLLISPKKIYIYSSCDCYYYFGCKVMTYLY